MRSIDGRSDPIMHIGSIVMLRAAKHLAADGERPFAAAQGDMVRDLRLMRIGADKSALGAINRPLQAPLYLHRGTSFKSFLSFSIKVNACMVYFGYYPAFA